MSEQYVKPNIPSESFCTLPWTHLNIQPNGDIYPCCMAPYNKPIGNISKSTLEEMGISGSRINAKGFGSSKPIADNSNEEGRAKNRRTKIIIMPKIDQFYEMIESEMKNLSGK